MKRYVLSLTVVDQKFQEHMIHTEVTVAEVASWMKQSQKGMDKDDEELVADVHCGIT